MPPTASIAPTPERSRFLIIPTPDPNALFFRVALTPELAQLINATARTLVNYPGLKAGACGSELG